MAGIPIKNIKQNEFNNITPFFRNYKTRDINDIDTVVLHWTAGSTVDGAVRTLLKKGYGYHFLISKDGGPGGGPPIPEGGPPIPGGGPCDTSGP